MAGWIADFEFPHEFLEEGEEFGYRSNTRMQTITNENAADSIGMEITIYSSGAVVNPSVVRVESDERLTLGTTSHPFVMEAGDRVRITTADNDKHVYLIRNGVETEVNEYLTEDSVFIQLMRGTNSIGYDSTSGTDAMEVHITYRMKYAGA